MNIRNEMRLMFIRKHDGFRGAPFLEGNPKPTAFLSLDKRSDVEGLRERILGCPILVVVVECLEIGVVLGL
jgi:hypothetical protein